MKTSPTPRSLLRSPIRRAAALALAAAGGLTLPATAADAEPAEKPAEEPAPEEPSPYKNWIELSLGGTSVDGNTAAFRQRSQLPEGVYGGLSSLHYEQEVATNTVFKLDAHGLFDQRDYSVGVEIKKEEVGYLKAGVSAFRTYYDGSGGYFPADSLWYGNLYDDEMAVDRRRYWVEAGLQLPTWPEITLRYERTEREGQKGSTAWGDATTSAGVRRIAPAFYDLDEVRDLITLDARKTFGRTEVALGFRYEQQDANNSRNLRAYPGEGPVWDRSVTQRETSEADLFNVHGFAETRLNDKVRFSVGYAYTDLDTQVTGYRLYGTAYDPDVAQRVPDGNAFEGLSGTSKMSQHVANLNVFWNLAAGLDLIPSLRFEKQDLDARSEYGMPAAPLTPISYGASSDRGLLDVSEALELRYSGITNVVLYARGDWLQGSGNLDETWDSLTSSVNVLNRSSDDERTGQKYGVGASWYPVRRVSLSTGYYHKVRENEFDHPRDSTPNAPPSPNRYPAYLTAREYEVDNANVRATWRPCNTLTLVARYDFQIGELSSHAGSLDDVDTAELTSHIVSGSFSWVPLRRLYIQGRLSYIQDSTDTPVDDLTPAVQDAENDYWTAYALVGYALSNDVDLEASYFYYRADNFVDNSAYGLPYGAGAEEHGVTAGVTWRINPRMRCVARYGFMTSNDDTSGGNNDFDAHLLQASVQYRF